MSGGTALYFYKRPDGTIGPTDEDSIEYLKKLGQGEVFQATVRKARNYRFLKKFMALIKTGFNCQEKYPTFEAFREEVTILAGWFTTHAHNDGSVSFQAKSVAFDAMDELEFEKLYQAAIDVLLKHFVANMTEDELRNATADEISRFATTRGDY